MTLIDGVVMSRHYENSECWLEVQHAAPRATFAASLLRRMRTGETGLEFTLDRVALGAVLRIRARNRTLIYHLVEHDEVLDIFTGVWPDLAG